MIAVFDTDTTSLQIAVALGTLGSRHGSRDVPGDGGDHGRPPPGQGRHRVGYERRRPRARRHARRRGPRQHPHLELRPRHGRRNRRPAPRCGRGGERQRRRRPRGRRPTRWRSGRPLCRHGEQRVRPRHGHDRHPRAGGGSDRRADRPRVPALAGPGRDGTHSAPSPSRPQRGRTTTMARALISARARRASRRSCRADARPLGRSEPICVT
jgi:mycobactin peptide synthetase MbtF